MARTARLLEILIKVQTKPRFTVQEMADEFGVSRRTMLRDLQALSAMGVPLAATPGPHGGYMLIQKQRLLPLSLTIDEALGVLLSYESFLHYAQSPFAPQSLSAITKLRAALPPLRRGLRSRLSGHAARTRQEQRRDSPHGRRFHAELSSHGALLPEVRCPVQTGCPG